jgi:hypothetical protein
MLLLLRLRCLKAKMRIVLEKPEIISPRGATCNSLGREPQESNAKRYKAPEGRHMTYLAVGCVAPPGLETHDI